MFTGTTPESLIPRSDSRNPATTCKGITKSGRPCRRPIDAKASDDNGVIAVVSVVGDDSDDDEIGAAAYFCWQHKDQAEQLATQATSGPATQLYPLKERNSIDTLVERLGVLDFGEPDEAATHQKKNNRQARRTSGSRPPRRINRPATWDNVEGPLMSVPSDVMAERKRKDRRPSKPPPQRKKQSFWASLCCGSADDDEYAEVVRHKRRTDEKSAADHDGQESPMQQRPQHPPRVRQDHRRQSGQNSRPPSSSRPPSASRPSNDPPTRKPLGEKPARPVNRTTREESETAKLLRYIPNTLPPQLASTLLAQLSKPISPHDEEGYIYIFWLTPESAGPAPSSAASTLLVPPTRPDQGRRTSDVMRQFSVKGGQRQQPNTARSRSGDANPPPERDTILLKIGRANNVHRRMNEWTRQCGYSLSLVRYYPYVSSSTPSPQPSPAQSRRQSNTNTGPASDSVRKVPHAHRVERLIHLELADQRVIKQCDACGKTHKEWFEVEATRDGVKKVDEVVKRWVDWDEKTNV
ncbi:hypothetical protein G6011_01578 [Alternaria panax]|uniref:Bacteriophage T5 Orf172 DNA-binding domain-containing protein n=1 Tax=Alternaria panax TaxID=48097 RepID=A0AAD4IKX1_9PLEO|nr:hypothetical protein G6011_01578 [Alternaria panax]